MEVLGAEEQKLVEEHYEYALKIGRASPIHGVNPDAVNDGAVDGLIGAIRTYDPSKGSLPAHIRRTIKYRILDAARAADPLSRRVRDLIKRLDELGGMSIEQMAKETGSTVKEILVAFEAKKGASDQLNLDADKVKGASMHECIVSTGRSSGENEQIAAIDRSRRRKQMLKILSYEEKRIFHLRYTEEKTLLEIAHEFGLTEARISQKVKRIREKIARRFKSSSRKKVI